MDYYEEPLVTVIIPTFNSSNTLKIAIQSLLAQDFKNFEAWIIGDACTDETEQIVENFNDKRLHWFNLSENSGSQSVPNNEGLKRAKGKYIAHLGHDDIWFPQHLSILVEYIKSAQVNFAYCLSVLLGPDSHTLVSGEKDLNTNRKFLTGHLHIPPSSWLYSKAIYDECGPWEIADNLYLPVDVEYIRRIIYKEKKIGFCSDVFILKFPSAWWGHYSRKKNFPQQEYWDRIMENPQQVAMGVFKSIARSYSLKYYENFFVKKSFKLLLKSIFHYITYTYCYDRWPLRAWLIYRHKRLRQKNKIRRGIKI